jgi:hypothetical protein
MRTRRIARIGTTTVVAMASLALLLAVPGPASTQDKCRPDQSQPHNQGAIAFGARTVLGQTFLPAAPGTRVCWVKLAITKNAAGAGNLTLRLMRSDFTNLDAAVTIAGAAIPMGNSVQLFDFGCNGLPLAGSPFYGLRLESPGSRLGAYSWKGAANNPYDKPGNAGRGWRNANMGAGGWTNLGGWDFAFEIFRCN